MKRRTFLKIVGLARPILLFFSKISRVLGGRTQKHSDKSFWQDKGFFQQTVDVSAYDKGIIKARIDGNWREFPIRSASKEFIDWNLKKRREFSNDIKKGKMPNFSGPHFGAVASYGLRRADSEFTLNNAVKGIGLAPKDEHLDALINRLKETYDKPMPEKMDVLRSLYENPDLFDWRKQTSLELYSTPDFETHTFLNIMENPIATLVFPDIPSYELRTIARIVHPADKSAPESEKRLLEFVNLAHEYMHGKFKRIFPLLLFYIIEEFNNTPGSNY